MMIFGDISWHNYDIWWHFMTKHVVHYDISWHFMTNVFSLIQVWPEFSNPDLAFPSWEVFTTTCPCISMTVIHFVKHVLQFQAELTVHDGNLCNPWHKNAIHFHGAHPCRLQLTVAQIHLPKCHGLQKGGHLLVAQMMHGQNLDFLHTQEM